MRKIADLTVDEFRQLVAEATEQAMWEFLGDPDEGLELQEWVKRRLKKSLEARAKGQKGIPLEEVVREMGLSAGSSGDRECKKKRGKLS